MTDESAPQPPEPAPSVFGTRSQDEMIARIDATAEDDLGSSFFDSSLQDAENAAVRMFDIGIRTITDEPGAPAAFGTPAPASAPAVARQPVAEGADGRFADPATRSAFILGGPAALG